MPLGSLRADIIINTVAEELSAIANGNFDATQFPRSIEELHKVFPQLSDDKICDILLLMARTMAQKEAQNAAQRIPAPTLSENKENHYRSKEERALEAKRRVRIKQIETEIAALEEEDAALNEALATPEVTGNFALLTEKCNRLEEIKNKLDELYAEYERLI